MQRVREIRTTGGELRGAGGTCTVSFDPKKGILFDWTGGSGDGNESGPAIDFKEDIHGIVEETGLLTLHPTAMFEMDSRCPNSVMVPQVEKLLRTNQKGEQTHIAIADHILNYNGFQPYTTGTRYETPEDAYKAYAKLLTTEKKYSAYKDTLPK